MSVEIYYVSSLAFVVIAWAQPRIALLAAGDAFCGISCWLQKNTVFAVVKVGAMTSLPNKIPANQHFQSTFLVCRKAWKLPRHSVLSFIGASFDCFELMLSLVRSFSLMYVSVHRLSRTDWISFPRDLPFQVSVKYISDSLERAQIDPSLPCFVY